MTFNVAQIRFVPTAGSGQSIVSTFPLDIIRTVEPRSHGSRVVAITRGEPGGLMKLLHR